LRIIFVENRYKTVFWEKIARELEKKGHKIFWIVQNHHFIPTVGEVHIIEYFKSGISVDRKTSESLNKIIQSDRNLNYFEASSDEYFYYYQEKIQEIINAVKPNVVFGESTLFHELLIIDRCKKENILFLHPTACRYPTGRFSFYKYDTLEPFSQCEEVISNEIAADIIYGIANRTTKPDYMAKPIPLSLIDKVQDKFRLLSAYYQGEKYNTPNPFVKLKLERNKKQIIQKWDSIAYDIDIFDKIASYNILYPLQMQPEANIDVWGSPNSNQTKVIEDIILLLEDGEKLILKPNPKSKYEINEEIISFVEKYKDKVVLLKHSTSMNDVIHHIDFIVTVTGTISLEAFLSNKPFILIGDSALRYCFDNFDSGISTTKEIRVKIEEAKKGGLIYTDEEKIIFMRYNYVHSFRGIHGDGFQGRHYMLDENNMQFIYHSFSMILKHI
jgi:hypothetical protein